METINIHWNWTQFCGKSDDLVIWEPSKQDLGRCFEVLCLQFPLLTLISITSAYYCGKQTGWVVRSHFETNVLRVRFTLSLLLSMVPVVSIFYQVNFALEPLVPAQYFLASVQCLTWLTHFVYVLALRHRLGHSLRGPWLVQLLWLVNFIFLCIRYRTTYYNSTLIADGALQLQCETVNVVLQTLYGVTLLPSGRIRSDRATRYQPLANVQQPDSALLNSYSGFREELDPGYLGVAGEGWSYLAHLLFSWVDPLMLKGIGGHLQSTDSLFDLPSSLSASHLSEKLERALTQLSLFKALHRCFWKEFYGIGILKFIADVTGFFGPLLLNKIVSFIETKNEEIEDGYLYAAGLCAITLTGAFCNSHFNFLMAKVGLKIRGSLVCIVYKKTLALSTITLSRFSTGEIVNFMSTDTDRIVNSCGSFHSCWSIPFQIAVTLYLLYKQVGMAFITGVIFTLVLIPINKCIASQIGKLSTKLMEQKDNRVKLTLSVIQGIKTVKVHVWEDHFVSKISDIRLKELKYLKGRKYLDALCVYFWATTPVVISILTFCTYILMGNKLTAATVFTCIALLNMLIFPLNAFPWVLNGLTEAWVSLKRIQRLLEIDDLDVGEYYSPLPSVEPVTGSVVVRDGSFSWGPRQASIQHIDFVAFKGQFVGVFGTVGCGKSSLLAALLAEMNKTDGFVGLPDVKQGLAYVSQTPWLQRGTIRDNVLFGKAYDRTKYRAVLDACALTHDLDMFPAGDLSGVGESGATLSGGQRARIALARAVYQECNIYLLDDILSAVDLKVARHILQNCINGLLRDKTRILCTHQTQFLLQADSVVKMSEGSIMKQGLPAEVLPDYEEMLTSCQLEGNEKVASRPPAKSPSLAEHEDQDSLLGVERQETGSVAWRVYSTYLGAVGFLLSIFILVAITLMQVSRNGTDWWMAQWVTQSHNTTSLTDVLPLDTVSDIIPWIEPTTRYFLTIYVLIGICNSIFTLFRAFLFAYGGVEGATVLHQLLLHKIITAKIVFFDILPLGQILNRLSSDVYTVDDSLPFISNILLAQFFGVMGILVVMVYSLPELCLVMIPMVPMYIWLQNHYRHTSRELKRLSSTSLSPLYNHFTETLQGLITIRAFRAVPRFRRDNETKLEANQKAQLASQAAAQWLSLRLQLMGVIMVTGVSVMAAIQHHFTIANPGLVGLAISYALSITGSLSGLVNAFTETEREMVSVERVDQYLREISTEDIYESLSPPLFWLSQGVVMFNNVTLKYREHVVPSLQSVTFSTRPAERVGVVGRTGAGKSSLLAALFRLVELHEGEILIDSVNIAHIGLAQLRSRLAIIPQEPALFTGSLRENVDPLGQYSDGSIWTALRRCHLTGVVRDLDAVQALSTGQAQLLCLTRAVLHNAKILCVDEATANVDEETDRLIQETLRSSFRQSTVLTIAHRVRTIMDSDRVLVMGNGQVLEFDTPDNLMQNKDSHFYQLLHQDYDT